LDEAKRILIEYKKVLDVVAKRLIEVETIEQDEFDQILVANGIQPKRKKKIEEAETKI